MKGKAAWKSSKVGSFPKVKQGMWSSSKKQVKGSMWNKAKKTVKGRSKKTN
jgi:hypothetical protein